MQLRHVVLRSFLALSVAAALKCPDGSVKVDVNSCILIRHLDVHERDKEKSKHWSSAVKYCSIITVGGFKWDLPKVDTVNKRRAIANFTVSEIPAARNGSVHIWLGLRRFGPKTYLDGRGDLEWRDMTYWYWTRDNTTVYKTLKQQNLDFWAQDQPGNDRAKLKANWSYSEDCVAAFVAPKKAGGKDGRLSLHFQDDMCVAEHLNVPAFVCESVRKESKTEFIEQWYFYLICVLLIIVPIIVVVVVVILCYRRRRARSIKQRRSKQGEAPKRRPGRTSPGGHIGGADGLPDPYKSLHASEDSMSGDVDLRWSFRKSDRAKGKASILPPISPKPLSKKMSCPIPANKPRPEKKGGGGGEGSDDDEDHKYSNIEPPSAKKAMSKAPGLASPKIP